MSEHEEQMSASFIHDNISKAIAAAHKRGPITILRHNTPIGKIVYDPTLEGDEDDEVALSMLRRKFGTYMDMLAFGKTIKLIKLNRIVGWLVPDQKART